MAKKELYFESQRGMEMTEEEFRKKYKYKCSYACRDEELDELVNDAIRLSPYKLDIEVYEKWGEGEWAQSKYLVHGHDDVLWTNDVEEAIVFLKSSLSSIKKQPPT